MRHSIDLLCFWLLFRCALYLLTEATPMLPHRAARCDDERTAFTVFTDFTATTQFKAAARNRFVRG
jgi:hypothetical protein